MAASRIARTVPIVIAICLVTFPACAKYSGGTGEPNDPYQIATAEDLMLLGETPEDYDKHFILTADIDLDPNLPGRKVFDKALIGGDREFPFTGVFDGNDHTISHVVISGDRYVGLFGLLEASSMVRRLGLVDVEIDGSGFFGFGALVGYNRGSVVRCYSSGMITGGDFVGGLVGENRGALIDCNSTCAVRGDYLVGGLLGDNDGAVFTCHSDCSVTGSHYVGGLVGRNIGNMINCRSTGDVAGNEAVGGLVGINGYHGWRAIPGYIDSSYSLTTVRGEFLVGGLVGDHRHGDLVRCYSTGEVNGGTYVGGLVGYTWSTITATYSAGPVSGDPNVGGLVGGGWSSGLTASFWDTQTADQSTSFGGVGKTTVEMQMADTFLEAGWEFIDETTRGIWWILEGQDYPHLYWELIDDGQAQTGPVPGKASDPYPADGALGVTESSIERSFKLGWTAGPGAVAHNVYFGTDFDIVSQSNIDSASGTLIFQNLIGSELPLWPLEPDKTYYWRIDELGGDGTVAIGDVWSFTTALHTGFAPPKGRACFIGDTPVWVDGNLVPISNAIPGQVVRCGISQNKVEELQVHDGTFTCYDIRLESGNCITVAECHYFMTNSGGWLAVHDLKTGTPLKTSKGIVSVTTVARRRKPYVGKVFNMRVKDSDCYLVGKDALVVRDY